MVGTSTVFRFGEFAFDERRSELLHRGQPVDVGATQLRLLSYLVRHPGRVISKDEIHAEVWSDAVVSDTAVSSALLRLRRTLGDTDREPGWVQTLRGRGVRFAAPVERVTPASADRPSPGREPPFVGRAEALAALETALGEAMQGTGRIVLLAGEAGIGKTRVALRLAEIAQRRGIPCYSGWAYEGEGAPAHWPWVRALRALVEDRGERVVRQAFGAGMSELARLLPELGEPTAPSRHVEGSHGARFRLFETMSRGLLRLAREEALVIFLDDLHWADVSSLRLLDFVARELDRERLLLLGAYRDSETGAGHPLTETLALLARRPGFERIGLAGLDAAESRELIERVSGPVGRDELVSILARTRGNPLFLREVARQRAAGSEPDGSLRVPPTVRDVIRARIGTLPPTTCEVLEAAAVLGPELSLDVLACMLELDHGAARERIDPAVVAGLLELGPDGDLRFSHALVQESVLSDLDRTQRARLHGRAGEALEQCLGGGVGSRAAELAHHYHCAATLAGSGEMARRAFETGFEAGRRAGVALALEQSREHYARALEHVREAGQLGTRRHCELLVNLADTSYLCGRDHPTVRELSLRGADLARQLDAPELLVRAALCAVRLNTVDDHVGVGLLEDALAAIGPERRRGRAVLLSLLGTLLAFTPRRDETDSLTREAMRIAAELDDPDVMGLSLLSRQNAFLAPDRIEDRRAVLLEAVETGGDWMEVQLPARTWLAAVELERGDLRQAELQIALVKQTAQRLRMDHAAGLNYDVMRALLEGRFDDAEALCDRAQERAQAFAGPNSAAYQAVRLATLHVERGRYEELAAIRALEAELPPAIRSLPAVGAVAAWIDLALGRIEVAREGFDRLAAVEFADIADDHNTLATLSWLSEVATALGDVPRASRLYDRLAVYPDRNVVMNQAILCRGSASRYLGLLAHALGRLDDAERHFQAAAAANARWGARPFLARTNFELARLLRDRGREGNLEQVWERLGAARDLADALGMAQLRTDCDALAA